MGLLSNADITSLIGNGIILSPIGGVSKADIKGASVDLTIGEIFVPGEDSAKAGNSLNNGMDEIILKEGHTAVIRTSERLNFDLEHAGIAFPAARISLGGLLMTNPGHIDPGYVGPLHVTVINMGRADICLKRGERLMRCLIFRLDSVSTVQLGALKDPITEKLLTRLSPDFLSVEERATEYAKREVKRAEFRITAWQVAAPVIGALLLALFGVWGSYRILENRLTKLEVSSPVADELDGRISKLETLLPLEQRMNALEGGAIRDIDERLQKIEKERKR